MDPKKRKRLEAGGWRVGSAADFLGLSDEEATYVELKLLLGESIRKRRQLRNLTQMELANILKSNQSRVARMEAGDPSVSIDLLIKSLLRLGASREELAGIISAE